MTERKRRFFSGPSLEAALVSAGCEFGLDPEEVSYQVVEKRHGFLRVRRNVVIQVDPESPRRVEERGQSRARKTDPEASLEPREEVVGEAVAPSVQPEPEEAVGRRIWEDGDEAEESEWDAGGEESAGETESGPRAETDARPPLRPRSRSSRDDRGRGEPAHEPIRGSRKPSRQVPREEAVRRTPASPKRRKSSLDPVEKRLKPAGGELAAGALEATEWLLDLLDMDVDAEIYEGEDRLEVELRGPDRSYLVAENGKVLSALEHLIPRVMRGVCGDTHPVRVDSENFQEEREDRLRGLAWETADRVRREGQAKILEAMDPADRRIVHLALSDDPEVTTRSLGEGFFKRVKVLLK